MKIGIIDADLIGRDRHRFPNLVCEKLSAYWKEQGASVKLLLSYKGLDKYDEVYISKVFTDTPMNGFPYDINNLPSNIHIGGTGFYFDKAEDLKPYIEHHIPDYHLYDSWISNDVKRKEIECEELGKPFNKSSYMVQYKEYLDYSIGFLTRGCFRKCGFCVNQKYDHVFKHSSLEEFYDDSRKKLCFLDDNFLGYPHWKDVLSEVIATGKPYKFKQGLDERLLTDEKCKMLFTSRYDGDFTFAFDNISDYDLIHEKLKLIRKYNKTKGVMFYVLVGFESTDEKDIENAFKRIALLMKYRCLPYIMRYMSENDAPWKHSNYKGMYITIARWCNQPSIFKKMSFRQFCEANQELHKTKDTLCASYRAMLDFEKKYPKIAKKYFDLRFDDYK